MTTTNAAFVTAVQAWSVTGVTRHFDEPPQSLKTADLPAAWPMLPSGEMGGYVTTCDDGKSKTRNINFIIAIEPAGQGTNATNYAQIAGLMDALETVLDADSTFVYPLEYTITSGPVLVAGNTYWAITASINGRDHQR